MNAPGILMTAGLLICAALAPHAGAATLEGGTIYVHGSSPYNNKMIVNQPVAITCIFTSDKWTTSTPKPWHIGLEIDGTQVKMIDAPPLLPNIINNNTFIMTPRSYSIETTWTPVTAGTHTARCVLDPKGELKKFTTVSIVPFKPKSFVVDVPPSPSLPKGPGGSQMSAGANANLAALPRLRLTLNAELLPNCAKNADVLRVRGRVTNTGGTPAVLPPGKVLVTIEPDAGVYGGSAAIGNLAPGAAQGISITLKPKNMPSTLAGAHLILTAWLDQAGVVNKDPDSTSKLELVVNFPAGYCNTSRAKPPRL